MIRLIVEVTAPDIDAGTPGVYRTFDIVNKDFEQFYASGPKQIVGHEIRPDPPAAPAKPTEPKVDPDAPPKGASALELYKHGKALDLKKEGKLPPKLTPTETLLEQYKRYTDAQREASDKETAKNRKASNDNTDEKARQAFNKRLKAAQAQWDAHKYWNTVRRIPRPTKESWRKLEEDDTKAAA